MYVVYLLLITCSFVQPLSLAERNRIHGVLQPCDCGFVRISVPLIEVYGFDEIEAPVEIDVSAGSEEVEQESEVVLVETALVCTSNATASNETSNVEVGKVFTEVIVALMTNHD